MLSQKTNVKLFKTFLFSRWQTNPDETKYHIALLSLTHAIRFFNKFNFGNIDVKVEQIGPSYVRLFLQTSYGPLVILQTVTPMEPLVQRVFHRFYAPRSLSWFMKFAIVAESIMVFKLNFNKS